MPQEVTALTNRVPHSLDVELFGPAEMRQRLVEIIQGVAGQAGHIVVVHPHSLVISEGSRCRATIRIEGSVGVRDESDSVLSDSSPLDARD